MNHHINKKRVQYIRQAIVYAIMTLAVAVLASFIIFFVYGWRFDLSSGEVTQYGMLQFNTEPSGASVTVDGKKIGGSTPSKISVAPGLHQVLIEKDGYSSWSKSVNVVHGVISWLDYVILTPDDLETEDVLSSVALYSSLVSPDSKHILMQSDKTVPNYEIADVSSDNVKSNKFEMPVDIYSKASAHIFTPQSWDDGERYVVVKHDYDKKVEWILLDTQDVARTKNITKIFNINFSDVKFAGSGGDHLFVIDDGNLRKLDVSGETISRSIASGVEKFCIYDTNNVIYVQNDEDTKSKVVGFYRDGNETTHILQTIGTEDSVSVATVRYFREDFIAISNGSNVSILKGNYPAGDNLETVDMQVAATFEASGVVTSLAYSKEGQYLLAKTAKGFSTYDMEYDTANTYDGELTRVGWLDEGHLWSDDDGGLVMMDFDGYNKQSINTVITNQSVLLTHNSKYIYSFNKVGETYQLQRTKLAN